MSQKSGQKEQSTPMFSKAQKDVRNKLASTYTPYIGEGTLGGLSDLEQNAVNMLKSADLWGPLTGTSTKLLGGELGAKPITSDEASKSFAESVQAPAIKNWEEYWKPGVKEEYAGPGYWGGERARAVTKGGQDLGQWLGSERANWMWDTGQANRAIEEAKAGRALSALGAVPGALTGWTSSLFGTGGAAREIENALTDPEVIQVAQILLGMPVGMTSRTTTSPSAFQQAQNWASALGGAATGISGMGGFSGIGKSLWSGAPAAAGAAGSAGSLSAALAAL